MTERDPLLPIVNTNGTSVDVLLAEYKTAYNACDEFITALAQITVHGRDYQMHVDPGGSFTKAQTRHYERMKKLGEIIHELRLVRDDLQAQRNERYNVYPIGRCRARSILKVKFDKGDRP
jgi:hypothetical protein